MDLFDAIDTQRSLRRFSDKPVSDDDIRRLLESARKAPSPTNRQPWAFIVIRDQSTRRAIAEIYKKSWGFAKQVYGRPMRSCAKNSAICNRLPIAPLSSSKPPKMKPQ